MVPEYKERLNRLYERTVLKEKDIWNFKKVGNETKYTKLVGSTRHYITTKGNKIVSAKKVIDENEYLIEKPVLDKFKRFLRNESLKENSLLKRIQSVKGWKDEEKYKQEINKIIKFIDYLNTHAFVKIKNKSFAAKLIMERMIETPKIGDNVWDMLSKDKSSGKYFQKGAVDPTLGVFFVNIHFLSNRKGNVLGTMGKSQRVADIIAKGKKFDSVPIYDVKSGKVEEGNHRVDELRKIGLKSVPVYISGAWD